MSSAAPVPSVGLKPDEPMRVIWSACETGGIAEDYAHRVLDAAAAEGVWGVELVCRSVDRFISYKALPKLTADVDARRLRRRQDALRRITAHAADAGLRLGLWHHEVHGPGNLLERLPELRADDGLIDLAGAALYDYIRGRVGEFFDLFPTIDELVLTLTETAYPVAHRPFCDIPVDERIRRVLQAVADVTEPRGRQLVIRPFSAIRSDELNVRKAVENLQAENVSVMYKTEPFDWHPFLPDEPLIGSIPKYEARAETDCGAEYYGQGVFPACYTRHIQRRLQAARSKGASTAVLRVDRGAKHTSLGHPVNEANIVPVTRWLQEPGRELAEHVAEWLEPTAGESSGRLAELLERTFDVIGHSLYIDQQAISHCRFPTLEMAKHILVFGLFEPDVDLEHLREVWSVVPGRRTLSHRQILEEKTESLTLARWILTEFDELADAVEPQRRRRIRELLSRLEILAEACLQLCRVIGAHTAEAWRLERDETDGFEAEGERLTQLADKVARQCGDPFFPARHGQGRHNTPMPAAMRGFVVGLTEERRIELPMRATLDADVDVIDYVLCGFASEGHRLGKRLHTGVALRLDDTFVRQSGIGPDEGFAYRLRLRPNEALTLSIALVDDGIGRAGAVRIGDAEHTFDPGPFKGVHELRLDVPSRPDEILPVSIRSATPAPCMATVIKLLRRSQEATH